VAVTVRDLNLTGVHEFDIRREELRLNPIPEFKPGQIYQFPLIQFIVVSDCFSEVFTASGKNNLVSSDCFAMEAEFHISVRLSVGFEGFIHLAEAVISRDGRGKHSGRKNFYCTYIARLHFGE